MASPLSVGALLVTQDNKIILGKRSSADTDIGKNKISVIGGYLDPNDDLYKENSIVDIFGLPGEKFMKKQALLTTILLI